MTMKVMAVGRKAFGVVRCNEGVEGQYLSKKKGPTTNFFANDNKDRIHI